ncbi:cell division protein ZapA [Thiospirillum jenense]|uniref:Cell division protein ZapA n=1 Tax=Thiospirillum jenense TaxID=1653858 RepID=A0A839HCY9_9GAMM|nr:cell division protein ZapA [Thiospirillum jenense]MBB1125057.1 cell division protein ZapA [Thiospirillum jenense]
MSHDTAPVSVHIMDKEYRINCSPEERRGLLESARLLDQRMREVRQTGRALGSDRIAVMAALNVIYEMMQERDQQALATTRLKLLQERISGAVTAMRAVGVQDS